MHQQKHITLKHLGTRGVLKGLSIDLVKLYVGLLCGVLASGTTLYSRVPKLESR